MTRIRTSRPIRRSRRDGFADVCGPCQAAAARKAGKTTTIGAAQSRRRGAAVQVGIDESAPLLMGEEDGVVRRIRVLEPAGGLKQGAGRWVTGSDVQGFIDSDYFEDITRRAQRKRLWKVPGVQLPYVNFQDASRAGAALGTTPIEVA